MGIVKRILGILRATIHSVLDRLQDQGLLLKQYLQDMEKALRYKEAKLQNKIISRTLAQQDNDSYQQQWDRLEKDLTIAVQKGKDDLARMLIKKMKPLDSLRAEITCQIKILDDEITQLSDTLNRQRIRYEQIKRRSTEYWRLKALI
jgi:phage shock protein A